MGADSDEGSSLPEREERKEIMPSKSNRKVNKRNIRRIVQWLLSGEWESIGEPIRFSHDGRLLDGRERLELMAEAASSTR